MTTKVTHIVKNDDTGYQFAPIDPTYAVALDAESLCYYDETNKFIRPLSNDTNAAKFLGVCLDEVPVNLTGTPVSPNNARNVARVLRSCRILLKATAADAIAPYVKIYAGADAQTMTVQAGSNAIGFIDGEQAVIASATAGTLILCVVNAVFPQAKS